MSARSYPRRTVDVHADVPVLVAAGLPGVQAHAYRDPDVVGPRLAEQGALCIQGCGDPVGNGPEDDEKAVALSAHFRTVLVGNRRMICRWAVRSSPYRSPSRLSRLVEPSMSLKQQGQGPGRQIGHGVGEASSRREIGTSCGTSYDAARRSARERVQSRP